MKLLEKSAFVLSIGNANPNTGATMYEWSIYDEFWNNKMYVFLAHGHLIFSSSENDFEIGEGITLRGNDNKRLLKSTTIQDKCICNRDALLEMLLKHSYDYYPARAFKKKRFNNKLGVSYSVKGIEDTRIK